MLDQQNKVMMSYGKFELNQGTGISTQKENIQSSENYAKIMILGIVDPNVAGFIATLKKEIDEGHGDHFMSDTLKRQLNTHFDKVKEVNTQAEALASYVLEKEGSIPINTIIPIGYQLINPIMNSLINNDLPIKKAFDELNKQVNENTLHSYRDQYINKDVDRVQLIYSDQSGDHLIYKNKEENDKADSINSIDSIPNITCEQKDLLKQLSAQTNWVPITFRSYNTFDNMTRALSGQVMKITQTQEGNLKVVLYGAYDLLNMEDEVPYSPPVSLTRIEVDLSNVKGDGTVNLASVIDLSVSAKTYYFDQKLQINGCTLEKADDHPAETLKEFCDISQKKTTHDINSAVSENSINQEEANQKILNSLKKHLEYFKCLYYGQNDKLKSLDLVINNIQQNGDLAYATGLICNNGDICNLSLDKIDTAANKIRIDYAESIYKIIQQNPGQQNYSTLLEQISQSTIDNFQILCTDDNQREMLEKNAKQFARLFLNELGELKFNEHPLESIIMFINKFVDSIFQDQMQEIMVGSKTENAKSFVKMIEERRNNQNNELEVH